LHALNNSKIASAVKSELQNKAGAELGKEVFGNPEMKDGNGRLNSDGVKKLQEIKAKYEVLTTEAIFELFNACNQEKINNSDFDIKSDLTSLKKNLSSETLEHINTGRESLKQSYEKFLDEFEKAETGKMNIKDKKGNDLEVNVVIGSSDKPLAFTNLAYTKVSPDTIVAVYAGDGRKGGDMYDVGISPDQANVVDLKDLCIELNKAEKVKRDEVYAKSENKRTDKEKELIKSWEEQGDREAFFGINDKISNGEINAEEVLKKDPTVLVAADSLIAASRTSLLTEEDFKKVFEKFQQRENIGSEAENRITPERLANLSTLETEIKADFSQALNQINQDKGIELKPRPDGFHLTIIGPTESKAFKEMSVEQLNTLKSINEKIQKGEGVTIEGIGFIDGAEGENIRKADKEKKTCFLAVSIPELQEFRTSLDLPEKDLHVTLGFEKGDIHMGITGQNKKGKDILSPISKKADPSLEQYNEMLNKDELHFGPLDGKEKQKKKEKPKKQEKIASYDSELMKSNLDSLPDEIKEVLDIEKLVELASQDDGKEVDGEVKKLGPQLRANMRFVKEALKKSEK